MASKLKIKSNTYIFGEDWSQIVAYGPNFANESNPQPLITVGEGGTGNVEIQNIMFTSQGALPGLVLLQWDIQAASQGSAALWGT